MQFLEPVAGLDTEPVGEELADSAERRERLGLPTAAVERQDQVVAQLLPERELGDQPGQFGYELGVPALDELYFGQRLVRGAPGVAEPVAGRLEVAAGQPGQGLRAPQRQSGPELGGRPVELAVGLAGPRRAYPLVEQVEVERAGRHPDLVARVAQGERLAGCARRSLRLERPAQAGDVFLDDVGAVLRRLVLPHRVDDLCRWDGFVGVEQQNGQDGALLAGPQVGLVAVVDHADRPQDLEPVRHNPSPRPALTSGFPTRQPVGSAPQHNGIGTAAGGRSISGGTPRPTERSQ